MIWTQLSGSAEQWQYGVAARGRGADTHIYTTQAAAAEVDIDFYLDSTYFIARLFVCVCV